MTKKSKSVTSNRHQLSDAAVTRALNAAAWDAVEAHRRADVPMVDWQDGKIVLVPAEEVQPPRKPKKSKRRGVK